MVKYGDKVPPKPNVRLGMSVRPDSEPGSERTLGGAWPDEFRTKYTQESWIGRLGGLRAKGLKIGQRHHEQNSELRSAKAANREPSVPDVSVRRQLLREDIKAYEEISASRRSIDDAVFAQRIGLKAFDFSKSTAHEIAMRNRYLDKLAGTDDKGRAALLKHREYREAALGGHHTLSGLSEMQHRQLEDSELKARWPSEMAVTEDHARADEIVGAVMDALKAAIDNEAKAIGYKPEQQPGAAQKQPDWD
jgi:hypothetical protein